MILILILTLTQTRTWDPGLNPDPNPDPNPSPNPSLATPILHYGVILTPLADEELNLRFSSSLLVTLTHIGL